jgi:hypothetical protein
MPDAKEVSSWSLEAVKEKIRYWESKDLFKARFLEYFILLGGVSFAVALIFKALLPI